MLNHEPHKAFIDPQRAALLVIDMQKGFCHPDSAMEQSGVGSANQRAIIPDVVRLVHMVRGFQIPIFSTKQIHFPNDVTRQRRAIPSHIDKQNWAPCLRGTWEVDFMPEIEEALASDDFVIEKHRASAFFETTLDAKFRMLGIQQVIVSGCTTDFCVESSIRDAYYRDLDVIVVQDCVAGPRQQFHDDTLAKVATYWGEVVSLVDVPELFLSGLRER